MNKNNFKAGLFLFFISISSALFSQSVGMNSSGQTPSANAVLDLNTGNSYNQGLLVPHVELGSSLSYFALVGSAGTKDTGMLIYNSNSVRQPIGYYYWNGSTWVSITSSGNWLLTGNAGTSPGTNFLGTTDGEALEFKVDGQKAGWIDYASPYNTTYGWEAGNAITSSATLNTALGLDALYSNTEQSGNIAIGDSALYTQSYSTAFNSGNVAIGNSTLYANQPVSLLFGPTGSKNTAIGQWAMRYNTTGAKNTAIGYSTLYSNTTGGSNTAHGSYALYSNTTGSSNTADGFQALYYNTNGGNNTATAENALFENTTGSDNIADGFQALYYNTTGDNNTAIGLEALLDNVTASSNTAIGYIALYNNTADANTALGDSAGYSNTSGTNNTYLGYEANTSGIYNNATALGAYSEVAQSNSLVLGGITGVNGGTSVNVGIGTNTPATDAALAIANGHLQSQQTTAPTIAVGADASAASFSGNATDVAGQISITTKATTGVGATITFNKTYNVAPIVVLTPTNSNAAAKATSMYVTASTSTFVVNYGTATTNGQALTYNYYVIETH